MKPGDRVTLAACSPWRSFAYFDEKRPIELIAPVGKLAKYWSVDFGGSDGRAKVPTADLVPLRMEMGKCTCGTLDCSECTYD